VESSLLVSINTPSEARQEIRVFRVFRYKIKVSEANNFHQPRRGITASVRRLSPAEVQPPGVIKYLLIRNYRENLRGIFPQPGAIHRHPFPDIDAIKYPFQHLAPLLIRQRRKRSFIRQALLQRSSCPFDHPLVGIIRPAGIQGKVILKPRRIPRQSAQLRIQRIVLILCGAFGVKTKVLHLPDNPVTERYRLRLKAVVNWHGCGDR